MILKRKYFIISLMVVTTLSLLFFLVVSIDRNSNTSKVLQDTQAIDLASSTSPEDLKIETANNTTCPQGFVTVVIDGKDNQGGTCVPLSPPVWNYIVGDGSQIYTISGYYSPYDIQIYRYNIEDEEHLATTTCKAFTVISGSSEIIDAYKNLVGIGNTVNRINSNGNLVLNIDFDETTKNAIVSSTLKAPVNLQIKVKPSKERDANYCESFIQILSVVTEI